MFATALEHESGAGHEVPDRARHDDLTGAGLSGDPRTNVDCEAAHRRSVELDLAGVNADAHVKPERAGILAVQAAPDGAGRAVEDRKEAIAGNVDLAPTMSRQQGPDPAVVRGEQVSSGPVSHRNRPSPSSRRCP